MAHNPVQHRRRSIRLKGYDYAQPGAYFVTICTHKGECLFGDVIDGKMQLNENGTIIKNEWLRIKELRSNVVIDKYIIMPNHVHGIIIIMGDGRGTLQRAPTIEQFGKPTHNSVPTIIRLFKSTTTKRINLTRKTPGASVWQRNYYEHVIRNEQDLNEVRQYVINNPLKWELDRENPNITKSDK